jgi:hypothetical protein
MGQLTQAAAIERLLGGDRTDEQMAKDGARLTLSQIDKLRNQLTQAERACQHVLATGKVRKDDAAIWRRVARASAKLLDDME